LVKRAYDGAALFALLNVVALLGIVGYLVATGSLNGERIRHAAMALRGEKLHLAAASGIQISAEESAAKDTASAKIAVLTEADQEIIYRESERIKAELEQRLTLNNSILLKVKTEREAFQKERETAAKREEASANVLREEGFRKQVEIMEALSPKIAIQHLMGISDPDEAAKVLMAMETGKAKKIVEAAKRGDDMNRMKAILQRVREVSPGGLAALSREEEP